MRRSANLPGQLCDFLGNGVLSTGADFSFCQEEGKEMCINKASLFGSLLWMKSIDQEKKKTTTFIIIWGLYRDSYEHQDSCPLHFFTFSFSVATSCAQVYVSNKDTDQQTVCSTLGLPSEASPAKVLSSAFLLVMREHGFEWKFMILCFLFCYGFLFCMYTDQIYKPWLFVLPGLINEQILKKNQPSRLGRHLCWWYCTAV